MDVRHEIEIRALYGARKTKSRPTATITLNPSMTAAQIRHVLARVRAAFKVSDGYVANIQRWRGDGYGTL